jgi:lipid-A-disaccharide synthase
VYRGKYITIPNLMMQKEIVPEILQENATPENLANAMDTLLKNPQQQYDQFAALRETLGPADALDRSAKFAVALAQAGATP